MEKYANFSRHIQLTNRVSGVLHLSSGYNLKHLYYQYTIQE